jgi:tRNA(Arg) A34 adenosine deaminase TadA
MSELDFMRRAIELSRQNASSAAGGPFGAVVVHQGRIVGEGANRVVPDNDPTAHAEVVAIRAACHTLGRYALDGCVIYTSCEPCPMCLGAIWWARIAEIVYANDRADAAAIGFDDDALYREVAAPLHERHLPLRRMSAAEALAVFHQWFANPNRVPY